MNEGLNPLNILPKPAVGESPEAEDEMPRWRRPPKGYVARRTAVWLNIVYILLIFILGGLSLYLWWNARNAKRDLTQTEQRASNWWDELQALEAENQALKESTQQKLAALNQELEELAGPRLNWPVFDAYSLAFLRQSGAPKKVNEIELPATEKGFSFILNAENQATYPDYRLEIVDVNRKIIWQGDGLRRNRLGAFNMTLTRELLSEERYTIKIYGKRGTGLRLLEQYPIHIKQATSVTSPSSSPN